MNGSRKLERKKWLKAEKKKVSDGTRGKIYESGFHILKSKEETDEFLKKMFRAKKERIVIPVLAKGLKPKTHSRHEVYLADEMFIL